MTPIEIRNQRVFTAARERVFGAFAEPASLAQWWGPTGFSNRVVAFDFRPGGTWRIIMRAPDGAEYDNEARFMTISAPETIVYEHLQPMHRFVMTMLYREVSPQMTELTWAMALDRTADHERMADFLHQANEQNFDRLESFLASSHRPSQ